MHEGPDILEGQLRECYGRVVYSHKTHETCADILLDSLAKIKRWQIILSAIASTGFVAAIFGSGTIGGIAGLIAHTQRIHKGLRPRRTGSEAPASRSRPLDDP
jgi:hypothetical protein